MHYSQGSFSTAMLSKKRWTRPTLTSTHLTDAEMHEAKSSDKATVALGLRLKAAGRI